ncbi:SDR family oxidoreductase [Agromyces mediolanus]|uniref:SDR family NAD(P)-dependent oxidoreductase n=1 Tax=Agromyces mediolanus TaxID=41986 RepID=UPI00203F8CE3|nr:SDR family oxidoreductase [Agromyces mediolanus]MCM3657694.1 SDR family oxidoreductase [Agromyces mediolanus]
MTAPHPFRLDGKAVIVTGASSGIGAGIARLAARSGADVLLVGRSRSRLAELVQELRETGSSIASIAVDLRDDGAPEAVAAAALEAFDRIDVLVNAAGIYRMASLDDTSDEIFDEHWEVNVRAPFRLTRAVHRHLEPGASIVFVSSMSGRVGSPNDSAYCASKGAIELIVKALATELAPAGIRVNAVAPGNVRTPINAELITPELEAEILATTPAGRIGEVDDIAPAVLYLASDASRYVVGASLAVDGGFTAQ